MLRNVQSRSLSDVLAWLDMYVPRCAARSCELTVPHVPTENNIADFFTKPMKNWKQFSGFRRRVMNEPDTDTA